MANEVAAGPLDLQKLRFRGHAPSGEFRMDCPKCETGTVDVYVGVEKESEFYGIRMRQCEVGPAGCDLTDDEIVQIERECERRFDAAGGQKRPAERY